MSVCHSKEKDFVSEKAEGSISFKCLKCQSVDNKSLAIQNDGFVQDSVLHMAIQWCFSSTFYQVLSTTSANGKRVESSKAELYHGGISEAGQGVQETFSKV